MAGQNSKGDNSGAIKGGFIVFLFIVDTLGKVFRIIPEFRILRLTFHRK